MKVFAFILLLVSITSSYVYEKIPLNIYIADVRKELKEIGSLHFVEEYAYKDFEYTADNVKYILSGVKAKAVFFNPSMLSASVESQNYLSLNFSWYMPDNYKDISPYHLIFTANLTSNEKTYQIEFVSEASEIVFQKKYELYVEDKFYIPKGLIEITPIASKAKNLETKSPYSEELILEIVNAFLASYKEDINRAFNTGISGYYNSLPFEKLGQRIYVRRTSISNENNFDLTLEEMPYIESISGLGDFVILKRKGTLNGESSNETEIMSDTIINQRFNLHYTIYQKLISENLFGFEFEQSNNPASMYELTAEYLRKIIDLDESIPDTTKLKLEAQMVDVTFDPENKILGDLTIDVDIQSMEDHNSLFNFTFNIKFSLVPTLFQSGLNFVLLPKNIEITSIDTGYDIKDQTLFENWIKNTYLCALGNNEYNLMEVPLDLSYYFNTNDLRVELYGMEYLSIIKN